jgi:hypothetical protein
MSKRGSSYLRKALFQVAFAASLPDPAFSAFYQKKRSEGKHHLTAVARLHANSAMLFMQSLQTIPNIKFNNLPVFLFFGMVKPCLFRFVFLFILLRKFFLFFSKNS